MATNPVHTQVPTAQDVALVASHPHWQDLGDQTFQYRHDPTLTIGYEDGRWSLTNEDGTFILYALVPELLRYAELRMEGV